MVSATVAGSDGAHPDVSSVRVNTADDHRLKLNCFT
jgi:hypothetical protein